MENLGIYQKSLKAFLQAPLQLLVKQLCSAKSFETGIKSSLLLLLIENWSCNLIGVEMYFVYEKMYFKSSFFSKLTLIWQHFQSSGVT